MDSSFGPVSFDKATRSFFEHPQKAFHVLHPLSRGQHRLVRCRTGLTWDLVRWISRWPFALLGALTYVPDILSVLPSSLCMLRDSSLGPPALPGRRLPRNHSPPRSLRLWCACALAVLLAMLLTFCDNQQAMTEAHINILGPVPGVPGGYLIATSHILRDTWQSTIGVQTSFVTAHAASRGHFLPLKGLHQSNARDSRRDRRACR